MEHDSILGYISGDTVSMWFMHSVHRLLGTDENRRLDAPLMTVFGPYIHRNRDEIALEFLASDRDWLLSLDVDMVFEPEDVWKLYEVADEKGPGIYAAPYQLEEPCLVCGPWDADIPHVYHPMVALPEAPTRVGVVGMGFTLIHREVYEAIGEYPHAAITPWAGEDVSFCWRAKEHGFIPWLIPDSNPGHSKTMVLFPHGQMKNRIGTEVDLVRVRNVKDENPIKETEQ